MNLNGIIALIIVGVLSAALVYVHAPQGNGITGAASITPQADVLVAACGSASGFGAVAGDRLLVTADIVAAGTCFTMDVANVLLDCDGHTISGPGTAGTFGVSITASGTNVSNCVLTTFDDAVNIPFASTLDNITLRNNTVPLYRTNCVDGLSITAENITIANNTFGNVTGAVAGNCVSISGGALQNVLIANNTFNSIKTSNNGVSISTLGSRSRNVTIENNVFNGNITSVLSMSSVDVFRVADNNFNETSGTTAVVILSAVANGSVETNTFRDIDTAANVFAAVSFLNSANSTFAHHNMSMGVFCPPGSPCTNLTIANNSFTENALVDIAGQLHMISNNNWSDVSPSGGTYAGTELEMSNGFVQNNRFTNGVMFTVEVFNDNNTISGNNITNITGRGFVIHGRNNTVANNTVFNLTGIAFEANGSLHTFEGNNATFVLKLANTTLSLDIGKIFPQAPESGNAFLLNMTENVTVRANRVVVLPRIGQTSGVDGVWSQNGSRTNVSSNFFSGTRIAVRFTAMLNSTVVNNTINDSIHKGVVIEQGSNNTVQNNSVIGQPHETVPYLYRAAVELFETTQALVIRNVIQEYVTGLLIAEGTQNSTAMNNIYSTIRGHGIWSMFSSNNVLTQESITGATIGVRFFNTSLTNLTLSNITGGDIGVDVQQSQRSHFENVTQTAARTGINLDLFTNFSNLTNNSFTGNSEFDIVFDLFANNNNGTGNTFATSTSESGAFSNSVT